MVHFASSPSIVILPLPLYPPRSSPPSTIHHSPFTIHHSPIQSPQFANRIIVKADTTSRSKSEALHSPPLDPQWPPYAPPPHPAFWPPLALAPSPLSSAAPMQPSIPSPNSVKPCLPLNRPSPPNTPPPSTSPPNPPRPEQRPSTSTGGLLTSPPRSQKCNHTLWI